MYSNFKIEKLGKKEKLRSNYRVIDVRKIYRFFRDATPGVKVPNGTKYLEQHLFSYE